MRKFRASVEPFYDMKIGKYVEYLVHVSSEYFMLRATFSDKCGWPNFLAYVVPYINTCVASLHHAVYNPTDLNFGSCTALSTPFL
jgi:peptide methionine sulfoxide reductase MsrB